MILVVGATGDLGSRCARRLRSEGQPVRCLVRGSEGEVVLRGVGAEVVRGDLTVPASLRAACEGVDTVIATATAIARRLDGSSSSTIREVDEEGMSSLVDAAEAAGVRRFVYLSFSGVDGAIGTPLEQAKLAIEKRLGASSMQTVIARSDAFQEVHLAPMGRFDIAAGKVAIIGRGDTKRRWVATEDVAALLCALALEPAPPALIEFGGPEALTKNEALAIAQDLTHRKMKVQRMPRPVAHLAVRLLKRRNDALASALGAGLLQDLQEATWDDTALRQRGINAKSATDFLREQANQFR
ncbi:NAD(P)H-binding protein [Arthrobacter sp. ISL-48]|uniref:SDR family oxidoreductase n=1 Tax=Arthrobacter sp. ISL-48 TaxID=2819110 RepID=UPI001BEC51E5|nr:NAD(P)H-binding protein [Arthrobacter sp. ISL-48]MBT2531702.1 NAD(P)H-binding protein [Arthrobacter sp. ISL-48]